MHSFYKQIAQMSQRQTYVSAMVISGPYSRAKALWSEGGYVYTSEEIPLWTALAPALPQIRQQRLIEIGESTVFCEMLAGQPGMVICGCGHVSIPTIALGKMLGFRVTAIDDRPDFCDRARSAGADKVICAAFGDALAQIPDDWNNYFIIVTRGHRFDIECLKAVIHRPHAYIGMMGSRARVSAVVETLAAKGVSRTLLDTVHMPIGMRIMAETPEEIAVSIAAELISVKNEASAASHYSKEMLDALVAIERGADSTPQADDRHLGSPGSDGTCVLAGQDGACALAGQDGACALAGQDGAGVLAGQDGACALAVIVRRQGSAPRGAGAKMLVFESGRTIGTVGGGCAEAAVIQAARRHIREGTSGILAVDMTGQDNDAAGMACGGKIDVYIEPIA